jgi:MoxR-like ATPase
MQERTVTVAGENYPLPAPFFVLATQNPIEQEGTYPLPEAQLDRFMFNLWVDYPSFQEELQVVKSTTSAKDINIPKVMGAEEILYFQQLVRRVPVPDNVYEYAVSLVHKTRPNEQGSQLAKEFISWGAGPRASQNLIMGAKCHALLHGKFSPDIENVKAVAVNILRHRIMRNYKAADRKIEDIIKELM